MLLLAVALAAPAIIPRLAAADAPFVSIVPISDGNAATDETARANTPINTVAFKRQALTTVGGYQFTSYYHADGQLLIGRRKQVGDGWSDWTIRRTAFTSFNINDSHNTSTIGVDGDGVLHVAWGLHNNVMQYTRSSGSVLNDNAFTFTGDTTGNNTTTGVLAQEVPLYNQSITYPEFYNVPGSGDLLLGYRTGSSGDGDAHLARWNNSTNAWQGVRVGTSADSANPFIDNRVGTATLTASPYLNSLAFDSTGKLHVTWDYRYGSDSPSTNPHFSDYQTNHNFMYAVSNPTDAAGGGYATWRKQDGTLYRRNGIHDIDEGNAQVIVSIPEGSSLINQAAMTIDNHDRPVIASWWAPQAATGNHLRQYMLAWYDGAAWKTSQVSQRANENNNARVAESQLSTFNMSRPIVMVDEDDRVFVVYSDYQRGNVITVAYTESPLRDSWQHLDLTTENLNGWEPSYDRNRWANDGVLSMYYQPISGATGAAPSIMEWDARAYFATLASETYWNVDADGSWSTASNWSGGVLPGGVGAVVRFGGSGVAMSDDRIIDLAGARTVGTLTLNGIGPSGFTLNNGTLNLNAGTTTSTVNVATGIHTINASIAIAAAGADFAVTGVTSTLKLASFISGPGDLTKSGGGTLIITGASSYDQTFITGGTLQVGDGGVVGTLSSGGVAVSGAGTLAFNLSNDRTVANVISGADGSVKQDGPGTLTLTGSNTFGTGLGGIIAANGTLRRGTAGAFASSASLTTVGNGRIDLNAMDHTAARLAGNGGSITDLSSTPGTSTLGVSGSGTYSGSIHDGPTRLLKLAKTGGGTLALGGVSTFSGGTALSRGFIDVSNNSALGTSAVVMNPTASTVTTDATRLTLIDGVRISNPLTMQTANAGVATGSLQVLSGSATYAGPITISAVASTGGHFAGPATTGSLRIEGAISAPASLPKLVVRLGRVSFAGGGSYVGLDVRDGTTFVGATNGIATNAVVDLAGNASSTRAAVLDLSGFDQQIRGLTNALAPANAALVTNSSPLTVVRTLTISPTDGTVTSYGGGIVGNLALRVAGNGTQILTKSSTALSNGSFTYTGGTTVDSVAATLQLNEAAFNVGLSGAGVDVRRGKLSFNYATAATNPTAQLLAILDAGYDVSFASGTIRSSTATSSRGLGWKIADGMFIVAAALYGDADLDGAVAFGDLVAVAQHYNQASGATWSQGDTNYDGAVNFADLVALAQNYGDVASAGASVVALADADFAADWALAQSLVPEPTSLMISGTVAIAAAVRRRRALPRLQCLTLTSDC